VITEKFAVRQVLRFSSLRNPPAGEEGEQELVRTLRESAKTEDHAVRIVDKWIRESRFWPTPFDLSELADSIPATKTKPNAQCPHCYGQGWEIVYTLDTFERTYDGGVYKRREIIPDPKAAATLMGRVDRINQQVHSNARRCTHCEYGRTLKSVAADKTDADLPVVKADSLKFLDPADPPAKKKTNDEEKKPPPKQIRMITQEDIDRALREREAAKKDTDEEEPKDE
jgi:hypothetical protein